MEESLKARLIGAAVLVTLAVLLIPELLSGRKAVEPVAEEGTGQRGTRTFTIELGQGPGQATRSQPTSTAAAPAPAAGGSTAVPAGAKAAAEVPVEPQVEPTAEMPTSAQVLLLRPRHLPRSGKSPRQRQPRPKRCRRRRLPSRTRHPPW